MEEVGFDMRKARFLMLTLPFLLSMYRRLCVFEGLSVSYRDPHVHDADQNQMSLVY